MPFQVLADPHPWPRNRQTTLSACALIVVDMQHDYCSAGYYIEQAGYDTHRLRAPIAPIRRVLAAARRGGLRVLYTRHGRAPDTANEGASEGSTLAVRTAARGEPGWHIVPELVPEMSEVVIEKSTCSAFVSGELDQMLRDLGVRHLAFCGNTIDVCVHSTLRAAVDLNYECLLLEDCCGAVNAGLHAWAIESVKIEDGVFGTVSSAEALIKALSTLPQD